MKVSATSAYRQMNAARRRVAQRIIEKGEIPKQGNEAVRQYAELYGLIITARISKYLVSEYNNPNSLIHKDTLGKKKQRSTKKTDAEIKQIKDKRHTYNSYINSAQWYAFRKGILDKRGRKCERCGQTEGEIHAHHLTYERFTNELESDILLLCKKCHKKEHSFLRKQKKL